MIKEGFGDYFVYNPKRLGKLKGEKGLKMLEVDAKLRACKIYWKVSMLLTLDMGFCCQSRDQ